MVGNKLEARDDKKKALREFEFIQGLKLIDNVTIEFIKLYNWNESKKYNCYLVEKN